MQKIILNNIEYMVIKDYKDALNISEILEKFTDYFYDFDYIVGDYSYDKLRLKGFCKRENEKYQSFNDYDNVDNYLKDYCSYDCKYYILEKVDKKA